VSSGMLIPPGPVRVLVATKPVDFRKGMNGLAALVQEQLKADPFSGTIYCFRAKRADRVKLVFWDGTGLCLFCNYLASYCISFNLKRGLWCSPIWLPQRGL
jgi:transposase